MGKNRLKNSWFSSGKTRERQRQGQSEKTNKYDRKTFPLSITSIRICVRLWAKLNRLTLLIYLSPARHVESPSHATRASRSPFTDGVAKMKTNARVERMVGWHEDPDKCTWAMFKSHKNKYLIFCTHLQFAHEQTQKTTHFTSKWAKLFATGDKIEETKWIRARPNTPRERYMHHARCVRSRDDAATAETSAASTKTNNMTKCEQSRNMYV